MSSVPSFAPLLAAPPAVQVHAFVALAIFGLGLVQFVAEKGTAGHRRLGRVWVAGMAVVAASGFLIHGIRTWGPWSPIHLISAGVLIGLVFAVRAARRGEIERHRRIMAGLFVGGMVIAGGFTLLPGRVMHAVLFGG